MTISELKARKRELGFSNRMISEMSGVPLSTVEKVFSGMTEAPRYETLSKIEKALYSKGAEVLSHPTDYSNVDFNDYRVEVNEPVEAYSYGSFYNYDEKFAFKEKIQGQYTVEDYDSLPDGVRMELIDGVLYDLSIPTSVHQIIVGGIHAQLFSVLMSSGGKCTLFASPIAVQLDSNDARNTFEPDLVIVCDKNKLLNDKMRIIGAPDFVVEVLSPSTRGRDLVLKFNKYWENGVREYWVVDPEQPEVRVFVFEKGTPPTTYTFEDKAPLSIFGGKLSVDFAVIHEILRDRLGL